MATIISTAVKLLLDSTGFNAGIAQAVSATNSAAVQINAVSSASASLWRSFSTVLLTSGASHLASELTKIHPLLGAISASALFAATQINFAAVAQNLWTAATWATTAATAALAAVGIPLWVGIGAAVVVAAAAVWGLVAAYQAATGAISRSAEESEKQARAEAQREAAKKANASIEKDLMAMEAKMAGIGLSNIEKQIVLLDIIKGANDEQLKRARSVLEETEQRERQADVLKEIASLEKRAEQSGMSSLEKTLADLADSGASPDQVEGIKAKLQAVQAEESAARARDEAARQEQQARRHAAHEAAREAAEMARKAEHDVRDAERRVAEIERGGATGMNTTAPKYIQAGSAEADLEKTRTKPFERLTQIQEMQLEEAKRQLDELKRIAEAADNAAKDARQEANF